MIGRTFKGVEDTFKNAKSAFKGLTEVFPLLKNAIAATGIGALVIVFGLIVAAVMKASKSFEPLQLAFAKFGKVIDLVFKVLKPLTDFILNAFVGAIEFAAKAIAFLTGNLEEYNKAAANEETNAKLEKNLNQQELWFEANADKYDEFTQRKLKADIDYNKKKIELNQKFQDGEIKTQEKLDELLGEFLAKRNREINRADADRATKATELAKTASEKQKAANDKAIQARKDFENKLRELQNGNALLRIADENQKARLALEQQKINEVISITESVRNRERRRILLLEVDEKYRLLLKNLNDKIRQDEINAQIALDGEIQKLTAQTNTNILAAQRELLSLTRQDERTAFMERLKAAKVFGQEQLDALTAFDKITAEQLRKFDEERKINEILSYKSRLDFQNQFLTSAGEMLIADEANLILTTNKFFDQYNNIITRSYEKGIETVRVSGTVLKDLYKKEYEDRKIILAEQRKALEESRASGLIDTAKYLQTRDELNQRSLQNDAINTQRKIALDQLELQSKQTLTDKTVEMYSNAFSLLSTLFGDSLEMQKIAAIGEAGIAIARIVIDTQRANFAYKASVAALGPVGDALSIQYAIRNTISAGLAIATITAQGIQKLVAINTSQFKKPTTTANTGGTQYADGNFRGYATGGVISGPGSGTSDSIPARLSNGESVINANSTAMFLPFLSAMNQMGGGTAFNSNTMVASNDKPMTKEVNEPIIMRAYVVENEMTSIQQRQARLKELSVL